MRFFVLILLVLLLPLRGGMGGAMAAEVPHHGITHQKHQASKVGSAASTASIHGHLEDCDGHAKTHGGVAAAQAVQVAAADGAKTADSTSAGSTSADAACDACSACQSCHAVGLAFSATDMQPLPAPNAQPAALSPEFASAHAARDQKPPIS